MSSYFVFQVNCAEDEHSKLATDFSANEIAFFKKAVGFATFVTDSIAFNCFYGGQVEK